MKRANDGEDKAQPKRVMRVKLVQPASAPRDSLATAAPVAPDPPAQPARARPTSAAPDPLDVLQRFLGLVGQFYPHQLEPEHRYSVTDLQLTCKTLRSTWLARWHDAHKSWESFGDFPELACGFVLKTPKVIMYLGAGFLRPARLWNADESSLETSGEFAIAEFVRKSCFAIDLGAEVMLAKYYAAHRGPLLKRTAAWDAALQQIIVAALQKNWESLVGVVLAMTLRLFGEGLALPDFGAAGLGQFPWRAMEYLLERSVVQKKALSSPELKQWRDDANARCTHPATRHHHVIGSTVGLAHVWYHAHRGDAAPLRCTWVRSWDLRALCQWAVTACPPSEYLRVADYVLRVSAALEHCWDVDGRAPPERWTSEDLLAWFLRRAPPQLVHALSLPPQLYTTNAVWEQFRDHAHKIVAEASSLEHLCADADLHNAKHLALLRWLGAFKRLPLPLAWRLQLILTDPALDDAAKQQRLAASGVFSQLPHKDAELQKLINAMPLPTLLRVAQGSPFYVEHLLSACDRADAPPEDKLAVLSAKLAALTAVADLCATKPARDALIEWLKRERKKKRCTSFASRRRGELLELRGTADATRLLHVIAFLQSIE
jgi:hypothetical protein